jgi:hypothetical protein
MLVSAQVVPNNYIVLELRFLHSWHYMTLLERFPGIDINQFNEIQKRRNLPELGSRKNYKHKKGIM